MHGVTWLSPERRKDPFSVTHDATGAGIVADFIESVKRYTGTGTNLSWSQRYTVKALRSIPGLGAESAAFVIEEASMRLIGARREIIEEGREDGHG